MATTETVTILFTDMVGSTGLLERLGPEAAERARRDHVARLRAAVAAAGGREIKNVGDGLMVVFNSAAAGVACALDMQRRVDAAPDGGDAGRLRVGISAGDAEVDGSDYFGTPVVEASRLCGEAAGGQILATELVRLLAGDRGPHTYTTRGPLELKGFDRPVPVLEVHPDPQATAAHAGDGMDVPLPGLVALAAPYPFVGRAAEWDDLEATWAAASRGTRQAVLVDGEAGAGKTRLVTEFARAVHRRGGVVLYGLCSDDFELPYQPFVEALEHLLVTTDPEMVRELAGTGARDLAKLLPRLAVEGAGATRAGPGPSAADSDAERYRLYESVVELLGALARRRPVLLVLDDLHWADRPTVQLLGLLLRSAAVANLCLIGTYRSAPADVGEPLREAMPDLRRSPGVHRLSLRGFDRAGVEQLVAAIAGHGVDDDLALLVDALLAHTDGNAFLISELWRHLVDTVRLEQVDGRWRVAGRLDVVGSPEAVRDVVGQRLAALPRPTRSLLEVAAVAGATFDVELIAGATDMSPGAALEALQPALDSRLVEEAGAGALRFAHALVQRSVEDGLAASERRRRHLQVGEALESRRGSARLDQIARHYLAAVPLAPAATAVGFARLAARDALGSVGYEHAVGLLETALPLAGDWADRPDLLLDLAEARMKAGDTEGSFEAAAQAAELARRRGDGDRLVRAATLYEEATWRGARFGADAERLVQEALPHAANETTRARLLAGRSRALALSGRDDEALATADDAIAAARRLDDPAVLCQALWGPLFTRWMPETFTRQHDCAREAAALAASLGDDESQLYATDKMLIAPLLRGDLAETHRVLAEHGRLAQRARQPLFLLLDAQVRSTVALCEGRLEEAEACAEEAGNWGHLLTHAVGGYGVQLFEIRRQQGRLEEARPFVEAVARLGREGATWRAGLAALYAELGMLDEAGALLPGLVADDLAAVPRDSLWCGALAYLAAAAVATGDRDAAAVLYRMILPYRGLTLLTPALSCHGAADRYLGALAVVLQRRRDAVTHLEAAVALDDRGGARTWAAHSRYELGRLLAGQGRRDAERARALLDEALGLADDIGLARLVERCRHELERLSSMTASSPGDVGLTAREVAVLRLLADGCTNRKVGVELSISQHTVANHVRAILLKTGCTNRTEAASWAVRRGLGGDGPTTPP
jgi:class 3 adenylate cyclase/DNA-binding CsgD family transcriptional regulator